MANEAYYKRIEEIKQHAKAQTGYKEIPDLTKATPQQFEEYRNYNGVVRDMIEADRKINPEIYLSEFDQIVKAEYTKCMKSTGKIKLRAIAREVSKIIGRKTYPQTILDHLEQMGLYTVKSGY